MDGCESVSHKRNGDYITPKDDWGTPQWLFDLLNQEFHFNFDAAAVCENAKCNIMSSDSLNLSWYKGVGMPTGGRVWLNPPYSAGNIDKFMQKAYEESQKGAVVVCLVPCATDTRWWHNYVMKAQEIRFIRGRVKFVGYDAEGKQIKNSPTFSSCVVIFRPFDWINLGAPVIGKTIEQPARIKA
jgi:phage N-6-adenine-methyltransferase